MQTSFDNDRRKARAIENQCYVIAAAQVGKHNEMRESYGHSLGTLIRRRRLALFLRVETIDIMNYIILSIAHSLRSMG